MDIGQSEDEEALLSEQFEEQAGSRESSDAEFDPDEQDEGIEDYIISGYHPVHIGEVIFSRYVVIQKLGWGRFSTVWLAKDFKYSTYVALKIQKSDHRYLESAYDQVQILQKAGRAMQSPQWLSRLREYSPQVRSSLTQKQQFTRQDTPVVTLLNCFLFHGPYGRHFCLTFEVLGCNLYEIMKRYNREGIPLQLCRSIARQVLVGLDFLHRECSIIHTDIKPENILVCLTREEINQIVKEGMLKQNKAFEERVKDYQRAHGIVARVHQNQSQQLTNDIQAAKSRLDKLESEYCSRAMLSKCKKKNLRRTIGKLRAKVETLRSKASEVENEQKPPEPSGLKLLNFQAPTRTLFKGWRGSKLTEDVRIKIADLGNACWCHHHFSSTIQTRGYRSPEVIVGLSYAPSADIWSLGCVLFELLTGALLFSPSKQITHSENEDHLSLIHSVIGPCPPEFAFAGSKSGHYYDRKGKLKHARWMPYCSISELLTSRYSILPEEAKLFQEFLRPMLIWTPRLRISARNALESGWLNRKGPFLYRMSDWEAQDYMRFGLKQEKEEMERASVMEGGSQGPVRDEESPEQEGRCPIGIHLVDVSFSDLGYVGYSEGLNLQALDEKPNWQFV